MDSCPRSSTPAAPASHFGPLFLLWVGVLGLSTYSLVASAPWASRAPAAGRPGPVALLPAWTLIALGVLFTLIWLSEIVPDLLAGRPSTSAAALRIPSNPVHVLDLALLLPGVIASGVLLLRRRAAGLAVAPAALVVMALTCLPVLVTPLVAVARGHEAAAAVTIPIGLVLAITLAALWSLLRRDSVTDSQT